MKILVSVSAGAISKKKGAISKGAWGLKT